MMTMLHLEYERPSRWQCSGGCSGKVCEEGQQLEKAGLFFGDIPWAGVAVLERTEPGVLLGV